MFVFSKMHDWQNDPAVKQILVFPSKETMDNFDVKFAEKIATEDIESASENNLGAIYKLRAVKCGNGMWVGVIRDGFCGLQMHETRVSYDTPRKALKALIEELKELLSDDLSNLANSLG
jgi:hypothetical protein